MISFFKTKYDLYVQIFLGKVSLKNLQTGEESQIDSEAFGHPRTLIGKSFDDAVAAIRRLHAKDSGLEKGKVSRVVVHVQRELEDGLGDIERRALRDLFSMAMDADISIMEEPGNFSDNELLNFLDKAGRS